MIRAIDVIEKWPDEALINLFIYDFSILETVCKLVSLEIELLNNINS